MRKVGLVSVTLNAVNPLMEYLLAEAKDIKTVNYLDTGLQDLVNREGGVTDLSLSRLLAILARTVEDGVEAVLLTCTVFSPYVDSLRSIFSFPLIAVDDVMLEEAVRRGGKTTILCTFPPTMKTSEAGFRKAEQRLGLSRELELVLVPGAYEALARGDKSIHDGMILEKIKEVEAQCDIIVLAQISMAGAAAMATSCSKPILTSPRAALSALRETLT